jgi:hypothetical protein
LHVDEGELDAERFDRLVAGDRREDATRRSRAT